MLVSKKAVRAVLHEDLSLYATERPLSRPLSDEEEGHIAYLVLSWNWLKPKFCFAFRLVDYINKDNIRFWASANDSYNTASANRRYPSVFTVRYALPSVIIFDAVVVRGAAVLAA
jgi:hypothetical protein